jgi:DNA-binding response OmpR family regulator
MNAQEKPRVLIADDEPPIVASLEFLMRSRGMETRTATDGETALEVCVAFRPHVLLLDVMLPKVSGFDVCRALRSRLTSDVLKIVLVTARGSEQDVARGREAGADLHIGKPFSTKELVGDVEQLIAGMRRDWTHLR